MLVPGLVLLLVATVAAAVWLWRSRRRTPALPASLTEARADSRPPGGAPLDLDADPWE